MTNNTPKSKQRKTLSDVVHEQDATFHHIAEQAIALGFPEVVLILSRPEGQHLIRFRGASMGRVAAILEEAEHGVMDKMVKAGSTPNHLAKVVASRRGKSVG